MKLLIEFPMLIENHVTDFANEGRIPSFFVRQAVEHFMSGFRHDLYPLSTSSRMKIKNIFLDDHLLTKLTNTNFEEESSWKAASDSTTPTQRKIFFQWVKISTLFHLKNAVNDSDPPFEPRK